MPKFFVVDSFTRIHETQNPMGIMRSKYSTKALSIIIVVNARHHIFSQAD